MSEHQDAIDAVMKSLGSAEPSAGFQARMHHALRHAPAAKRTWQTPFAFMATAALLLCAVLVGVRTQNQRQAVVVAQPAKMFSPSVVAMTEDTNRLRPVIKGRVPKLIRVEVPVHADHEEAVATHQNIPPPPLPLTQEERLVIRMMRHNDLPQLAALSTDARTRSLHDDAESYREFFAPRPPLNGQPNYEQHIITGGSQ